MKQQEDQLRAKQWLLRRAIAYQRRLVVRRRSWVKGKLFKHTQLTSTRSGLVAAGHIQFRQNVGYMAFHSVRTED